MSWKFNEEEENYSRERKRRAVQHRSAYGITFLKPPVFHV